MLITWTWAIEIGRNVCDRRVGISTNKPLEPDFSGILLAALFWYIFRLESYHDPIKSDETKVLNVFSAGKHKGNRPINNLFSIEILADSAYHEFEYQKYHPIDDYQKYRRWVDHFLFAHTQTMVS